LIDSCWASGRCFSVHFTVAIRSKRSIRTRFLVGTGVIIQNTGGIRKLRWARGGGGKSGGVRVVYYFHSDMMPLYLLTVFGKNEKANISMKEKQILSKLVKELVSFWS